MFGAGSVKGFAQSLNCEGRAIYYSCLEFVGKSRPWYYLGESSTRFFGRIIDEKRDFGENGRV